MTLSVQVSPERLAGYGERLDRLVADRVASAIASADSALWGEAAQPEAAIRLGWVKNPREMIPLVEQVVALRDQFATEGVTRVVLCGMGGSSLAPEVMAKRDGVALEVLDSTHPDQVARALAGDLSKTVVVIASKSGTTVETATARVVFEQAFTDAGIDPATRVVIVTDPESPLHKDAVASGQRVFLADPHVGGRFSALTAFGLVPTTLAGVDTSAIIGEAATVWESLHVDVSSNPAAKLAAALSGPDRDVAALISDESALPGFGDWIEQLVAESTGKDGKGVLPVAIDSADSPDIVARFDDVVTVALGAGVHSSGIDVQLDAPLGAQFLLWEYATAMVGFLLDLNPFDQPDVESAKVAARALLDAPFEPSQPDLTLPGIEVWRGGLDTESVPSTLESVWDELLGEIGPSGYLSIQLYVDRGATSVPSDIRDQFARVAKRPVTVGFGPRFLHSTGQFHKGGTPDGVFLQVEVLAEHSVTIPGYPYDFQQLIGAQAAGDRRVLVERGRPVLAIRLASAKLLPELFATLTGRP